MPEESGKRKVKAGTIVDIVLGIFIVLLLALEINILVTSSQNHGVPSLFGTSFMKVLTNSMEGDDDPIRHIDVNHNGFYEDDVDINIPKRGPLNIPTNAGIIIKAVTFDEVQKGDCLTFYDSVAERLGAPITHRVIEIDYENRIIYCFGDNDYAETCVLTSGTCNYSGQRNTVNEDDIIGVVTWSNVAFGSFLGVLTSRWFLPVMVIIPLGVIAALSIVDVVKALKKENDRIEALVQAEVDRMNVDPNDEAAMMLAREKAEAKIEIREELEQEKERQRKQYKKVYEQEKRRLKKEMARGDVSLEPDTKEIAMPSEDAPTKENDDG